jgi:uncharacterized protein YqjF (DUF2071 family)
MWESSPQVRRPIMIHHWRLLTFVHWRYPAEVVQELLPPGLEIQTFDGSAWVGLVPFLMRGVRAPGVPPAPWLSQFPETNLRTYVLGPDGRRGIWFFSLDAARLPAVVAARTTYGLPYFWSDMAVRASGREILYWSRRRWPGPAGTTCDARVEVGRPYDEADLGDLDHFLTARHRLYSVLLGRLVCAEAEHGPWPLYQARLHSLDQTLTSAAGLPDPVDVPLVHASSGVRVRIGMWHPAKP